MKTIVPNASVDGQQQSLKFRKPFVTDAYAPSI